MAEGILRHFGKGGFEVFSAGTNPSAVNPLAVKVMAEAGVDISAQYSKSVSEFLGQDFEFIITVCDRARESCPIFPGDPEQIHWSFPDPAAVAGAEEERLNAFRRTQAELLRRIQLFIEAHPPKPNDSRA